MERNSLSGWCILRTSGGRTLALATSLAAAGYEVWSPVRTIKRPHGKRDLKGQRTTVEINLPILPTFVFARAACLPSLAHIAGDPAYQHPPFSIFSHAGRIPIICDASVAGLREEERAAAELIEQLRAAETREEQRRIKSAAMNTKREREKALRSERHDFAIGSLVSVDDQQSLLGMAGVVEQSNGASAVVAFGGTLIMTIEAWRLKPHAVSGASTAS
ncbi:hypothetical protein [Sphingomonas sp. CARO-RG-8B-R24-01]|uniref:hypothetical protein n=1 Tax=Sphingomonas sp. CARO-RG-8B-R24-01 TaxID=2914831 RepID=UPI001F5A49FA|nr:hypothetical protein [Sphingomonas sp. CARO-RG-8B-R24-01]